MASNNKPANSSKWRRFRHNPRAMISLMLLAVLYAVSLCTELICSSEPLYLKVGGKRFIPFISFVSEKQIFGEGADAAPDWLHLESDPRFSPERGDSVIFAPIRSGTADIMHPEDFAAYRRLNVTIKPDVKVARCDVDHALKLTGRHVGCEPFFDISDLSIPLPQLLGNGAAVDATGLYFAVSNRLSNIACPATSFTFGQVKISLAEFKPRAKAPKSARLRIEEAESEAARPISLSFERNEAGVLSPIAEGEWNALSPETRTEIEAMLTSGGEHSGDFARMASMPAEICVAEESIIWPFRPVPGHPMGIDGNGRDVFACILSGTRTAMTFGVVLVVWAMLIGIVAGAVQGYFGGWVDMAWQRFIEIWSSLPFLYVMILVGDVFGRSFALLLFCYGLFNWIGVSYYVRAEFLRLRKRPFVEAAKCLGLSSRQIIMRHILPNALTPVITLLPFSLVGAIASISALDFLGFGLPPLTPSWGELLQQAQENVQAWWLILYPSAMLFFVMLFAVFVGEGLRDAFDPKPAARYR